MKPYDKLTKAELHEFVQEISRLPHEGEPSDDADGDDCEWSSENAIAELNNLIMQARTILGATETCDACDQKVPYVIDAPDGQEICRDCFDHGVG